MKVAVVPGYGDPTGYIEFLTANWKKRYNLELAIHAFGSTDPPEKYPENWQRFVKFIDQEQPEAVIGISFGFSIACRALLDYPDQIKKIVSIAGPHELSALNPRTIETKYPMLGASLKAIEGRELPAKKILTLRPYRDKIIDPDKVIVPGAINRHIPMIGHHTGIPTALAVHGKTISRFLHENA